MRFLRLTLIGGIILSGLAFYGTQGGRAGQGEVSPLTLIAEDESLVMLWHDDLSSETDVTETLPTLPLVDVGGTHVPAQLVSVQVHHDGPIVPQVSELEMLPWTGNLPAAATVVPETSTGQLRPALAPVPASTPPDTPVVVLREGQVQEQRTAVLAVSPIFVRSGTLYRVSRMRVVVPDVVPLPLHEGVQRSSSDNESSPTDTVGQATAPRSQAAHTIWLPTIFRAPPVSRGIPPTNTLVSQQAWKITVAQQGIQRVSGNDLAAVGVDLNTLDVSRVQVWHNGVQIPLDARGVQAGKLQPTGTLSFYASPPGDRWNATDTYWLTIGSQPGLRMASQSAAPIGDPSRTTARQQGSWRNNQLYDSTLPGSDGDHWFAADLRTAPGQEAAFLEIDLEYRLSPATGPSTFTLHGSAYTPGPHRLELAMGAERRSVTWTGIGSWQHAFSFTQTPEAHIQIGLLPNGALSGVELDYITWDIPISLHMQERGATFIADAASQQYQLTGVSPGSHLYNVTDPGRPHIVGSAPDTELILVSEGSDQRYLLEGNGTVHTPQITSHIPHDLTAQRDIDALYIAPAAFHSALQPLVTHRQTQGYTIAVVNVQHIYDSWSYGQVSPEAIRAFLRYARDTWDSPPLAVTLVGDGTSDPFNYTGRNNPNLIPPYLAYVDPWLGETACETCYAQLDGDHPLDDSLPDLWLGRLPVKQVMELEHVVAKIITYETTALAAPWRNRAIFLTDNAVEADGRPDLASDFITDADVSIALQPSSLNIRRLSYDPSPEHHTASWREPNPTRARDRTIELLNEGAGLVTFFGHSHHWQWALTDPTHNPSHLLELFEVDQLRNDDRLPVVLTMTCLSSAFQEPAYSGTTIDERLVLQASGGAVAVWGPTGRGVAHGHNLLQQGFYQKLWHPSSPGQGLLGELTQSGYEELFLLGTCCQSTLRTFVLFGDPLTQVRVIPATVSSN